jgi:hypothetical protein
MNTTMSIYLTEINTQKRIEMNEDLSLFEGMRRWVEKEYSFSPSEEQILDYFMGYRMIGNINGKPEDLNQDHYSLPMKDLVIDLKQKNERLIFLSHRLRCH